MSDTCRFCRIAKKLPGNDQLTVRRWKRPLILLSSLFGCLPLSVWLVYLAVIRGTGLYALAGVSILAAVIAGLGILGLHFSFFACDKCVARIAGRFDFIP